MKTQVFEKDKIPKIDYNNYKVILIGVSNYPEDKKVKNVPNIKINIDTLNNVLSNKQLVGIPKKNIFVSLNKSKVEIEKSLSAFIKETNEDDTVLIYYTGHGFISSETFELFLATADTQLDYIDSTGISIKRFRQIISQSFAKRKIIILDACHSGGVHNSLSDNKSLFTSVLNKFEGEYVISSSSEDEPSLYPVGKKNLPTFFTGELVNIITSGINNGNPFITMSDIFKRIYNSLKAKNLPLPQQSNNNNAGEIPVVKNSLFNDELTDVQFQEIQKKYFHLSNKSKADVRVISKKNVVFNAIASITVAAAFASVFVFNSGKKVEIAHTPVSSNYEITNKKYVVNSSFGIVELDPIVIEAQNVDHLLEKASVFINADGGYDLAVKTLNDVLEIDPDNANAIYLLDSLKSTQN